MNRYGSLSILLGALVVALSPACGTIEVPFMPSFGGAGGSTTDGSDTDGPDSGGSGGTEGARTGGEGGGPPGGGSPSAGGGPTSDGGVWGGGAAGGADGAEVIVRATSKITAVAANQTHVYWTENGTKDELSNYLFNGALRRMSLDGDEVETLVEGLGEPSALGLTTAEVYMKLELSTIRNPEGAEDLVRVPLTGGALERLPQSGSYSWLFRMSAVDDRAYFYLRPDDEWIVHESRPGQEPRQVLPGPTYMDTHADATHLYFYDDDELMKYAIDGTEEPTLVSDRYYPTLFLDGDRILTIRGRTPGYIAAFPKSGGTWKNILSLGERECRELEVQGIRFAAACDSNTLPHLITGLLDGNASQKAIPLSDSNQPWALAEGAVIVADGKELVRVKFD